MTLVTRAGKGAPLDADDHDANLDALMRRIGDTISPDDFPVPADQDRLLAAEASSARIVMLRPGRIYDIQSAIRFFRGKSMLSLAPLPAVLEEDGHFVPGNNFQPVIRNTNPETDAIIIAAAGAQPDNGPVHLRGFTITNDYRAGGFGRGKAIGIGGRQGNGILIEDMLLRDLALSGILSGATNELSQPTRHMTIRNVIIYRTRRDAMQLNDCEHALVERCRIYYTGDDAIALNGLENRHCQAVYNYIYRAGDIDAYSPDPALNPRPFGYAFKVHGTDTLIAHNFAFRPHSFLGIKPGNRATDPDHHKPTRIKVYDNICMGLGREGSRPAAPHPFAGQGPAPQDCIRIVRKQDNPGEPWVNVGRVEVCRNFFLLTREHEDGTFGRPGPDYVRLAGRVDDFVSEDNVIIDGRYFLNSNAGGFERFVSRRDTFSGGSGVHVFITNDRANPNGTLLIEDGDFTATTANTMFARVQGNAKVGTIHLRNCSFNGSFTDEMIRIVDGARVERLVVENCRLNGQPWKPRFQPYSLDAIGSLMVIHTPGPALPDLDRPVSEQPTHDEVEALRVQVNSLAERLRAAGLIER